MARAPFLVLSICIGWSVVTLGKLKLNGNYNSHHDEQVVTQPDAKRSSGRSRLYSSRPLSSHFGIEALEIDLNDPSLTESDEFISQLKEDLVQHRAVLFRSQHLSGERQVEISKALGKIARDGEEQHPKSPHPDIYHISNNRGEGYQGVGTHHWHNDGISLMSPFIYLTMYFPSVSEGGDTYFIPLKEFYDSLSAEEKEHYNHLWLKAGGKKAPIHPLVFRHPLSPKGEEAMLLHTGRNTRWYHSDDNGNHDKTPVNDNSVVREQLTKQLDSQLDAIGLRMKWQKGDFMIFDNLATAHYASQGTLEKSHDVGLRVLHRTAILGDGKDDIILSKT